MHVSVKCVGLRPCVTPNVCIWVPLGVCPHVCLLAGMNFTPLCQCSNMMCDQACVVLNKQNKITNFNLVTHNVLLEMSQLEGEKYFLHLYCE